MAKDRHREDCVVAGVCLARGRPGSGEVDSFISAPEMSESAHRNIERIDVEAEDDCLRKIASQTEHFLSRRTSERQDVRGCTVSDRLTYKLKYARVSIDGSGSVRLVKAFRRPQ